MSLEKMIEYAVWSRLDRVDNVELIVLKGHLLLESVIDNSLSLLVNRGSVDSIGLSFYKKLQLLQLLHTMTDVEFDRAKDFAVQLNKLRNRLAHQIDFAVYTNELQQWAESVITTLPGTKFTKHTFRTKVVHAFASLASELSRAAKVEPGKNAKES